MSEIRLWRDTLSLYLSHTHHYLVVPCHHHLPIAQLNYLLLWKVAAADSVLLPTIAKHFLQVVEQEGLLNYSPTLCK